MHRSLLLVAVALLIGIAATIAVAWLAALLAPRALSADHTYRERARTDFSIYSEWTVGSANSFGVQLFDAVWDPNPWESRPSTDPLPGDVVPRWTNMSAEWSGNWEQRVVAGFGWPASAFRCEYKLESHGPPDWLFRFSSYDGVDTRFDPIILNSAHSLPRTIPLRPIWIGLALDVGAWSTAALVCILLVHSIRSGIRRRRGSCAACGYALHGLLVCPECGTEDRPAA